MSYETIILQKEEGVAKITLNRPEKMNALNEKLIDEFFEVIQDVKLDRDVKVVLITGAGKALL